MVEAKIFNVYNFKNIFDVVKDIISDGPLYFSKNSVCLQAINALQVSLVELNFEAKYFETYQCDRPNTVGINPSDIYKILKCSKAEDICTLNFEETNEFITLLFEDTKGRKQQSSLKLFKPNYENLLTPELTFPCEIEMSSKEFQKICHDAISFSNTLIIETENSKVSFRGSGNFASYRITYSQINCCDDVNENSVILKIKENASTEFAIKHILPITKSVLFSNRVYISFGNKLPLYIRYNTNNASLKYFLAPIT